MKPSAHLLVLLGTLAWACGGESSSGSNAAGSCRLPAPCGGDLVGKWQVTKACAGKPVPVRGCPGSSMSITDLQVTGTLEFRADGTMTDATTGSFHGEMSIPNSCLSSTCDAKRVGADQCTPSSDTCHCSEDVAGSTSPSVMTYVTSGATATLTDSTGSAVDADYCIQGNVLTWWFLGDDSAASQAERITGM